MTAIASTRVLEAQERLTHIRRLIDSTTCEALLPALELYAMDLERSLGVKNHASRSQRGKPPAGGKFRAARSHTAAQPTRSHAG